MNIKIGLLLHLPEGKLQGYYAQIVKGLANRAVLFDRDKELLVLSTAEERDAVLDLLHQYKADSEEMELLLLPDGAEVYRGFTDYGFESRAGNRYLYADRVAVFSFAGDGGERKHALLQMEENILARWEGQSGMLYAVDADQTELMAGIAKAYQSTLHFV